MSGANYTRCPWCDLLLFQDGECGDGGFTGTCAYCDYLVEPDNEHPQYHAECAWEARAERMADRR